ncbi:MAG: xylan 1,4-beta-xylosidase [Saprospiraceae bacterium]|jgi:xylan 1,4-beta-xylosidase
MKKLLFLLVILPAFLNAQNHTFTNPIIPGGYPDPSICRVGDDYYIVNSSFEYFPGLPIHHSKDLVNWELVAYGLHREDQCTGEMNLVDVQQRGGIHAPTIRYHQGKFYIITTNVYSPKDRSLPTKMINFIITAENIEGPWSEPHILKGAPGIDPDIFFDEDGKVWYVGTHAPEKPNFNGEGEIWLQEIDLDNWKLQGERYYLWRGACAGTWAEGPHIYKRDGRYYLVVAEGGTSFNHGVMVAVSDEITGPYISNARNPILTTRHLSYDFWVNSTGHADMVELPDGRWYMVALGIRGDEERASNMGRETHLVPVQWEREPFEWKKIKHEWPVVAPATGRVERFTPLPFEDKPQYRNDGFFDNFDSPTLDLEWNFRRVPMKNIYSLNAKTGSLRLYQKPEVILLRGRCSLMGVRQKETNFEYSASMNFKPQKEQSEAGISIFTQDDNYIMYTVAKEGENTILKLVVQERKKEPEIIKTTLLNNFTGDIIFKVVSKNQKYHYLYSNNNGQTFIPFAETASNLILCHGYTGAYVGIYATSNGYPTNEFADFNWVSYKGFQ